MLYAMIRRKAAGFALAASFSVYLIPLIGPHAAWLLGEMLFRGGAERSPRWAATNFAVALAIQLAVAVLFYWLFAKPGWRRAIPLLLAFPLAFLLAQPVFMVAIPTAFLEEPDLARENVSWKTLCSVPDVEQTQFHTASEIWVRYSQHPNQYAVLTMPDCRLARVTLPEPHLSPGGKVDFMIDVTSVIPGGRAVVRRWETGAGKASWWMVPGPESPLEPLPGEYAANSAPILSTDTAWTAWIERDRLFLRPRNPNGKERVVDLSGLGLGSFVLRRVDVASEEIRLWQNDRLVIAGFDGKLKHEYPRPNGLRPQYNTFLESGDHWLAWDAYRDADAYLIEWSLPGGGGRHRVPLGRTIHDAAVDDAGKRIAVSVGTSLNIGKAQDAVYVLDAADGREVFRRYLPRYDRSPVAFLQGGYFAYSDLSGVHVLRVPQ
jgi:hypothetical protein